jgi:hypothetical protein
MSELNDIRHLSDPPYRANQNHDTCLTKLLSGRHATAKIVIGSHSVSTAARHSVNSQFIGRHPDEAPAATSSAPSQDAAGAEIQGASA